MKLTHTLLSDKKWRPRNLGCLEDHTDHTVKSLIRSIRWTIRSPPKTYEASQLGTSLLSVTMSITLFPWDIKFFL